MQAKDREIVKDIKFALSSAQQNLRSWVNESVYSVYISVEYYSSSNTWLL
jgi:hypothetical protein